MQKNERFHESWFEHTCRNGLKVILFQKPQFYTSAFLLMTPFGNLDCTQKDESGTIYRAPSGTAHFLEHKLFESGSEDVMMRFSRLGANVNASTSYDLTSYFFTTPSEEVTTPLSCLLDFVQSLTITKASVAKEVKIILEELAMYRQDPDSRLFNEAMRAVYQKNLLRDDIVGTEESIAAMTKRDLEAAYLRNYHPSRMTLIGVTPADHQQIIEAIEANQDKKDFGKGVLLSRLPEEEPEETLQEQVTIRMAIEHPRCAVCFKMKPFSGSSAQLLKREWGLRLSLEAVFSPINPEFQGWIDSGTITPYFSYDLDCSKDSFFLYFQDETADVDAVYQFVKERLDRMKEETVDEDALSQMKRRMIGTIIRVMDNPLDMIGSWARGVLRDLTIFEECGIVESLDPQFCRKMMQELSLQNRSCLKLVPDSETASF
ncbi:MAG: insulinase family protein [Solobacterium sp.]|nr:insulinase family protein [Solobacterium sp.]